MKFCDILLFKNMSEQEITQMNKSKFMKKRIYAKNTHIYHMGDVIDSVGIVLSGNVIIENIDIWGNKSISQNFIKASFRCYNNIISFLIIL